MDLKELFLKQKTAIRERSEQVFTLIRAEHMDWRPEAGALTMGEMLQHLWVSEEGVRRVALEGNFAYYEKRIPQGLRATLGARNLAENLSNLARVHRETLAAFEALPLDRLEEERAHEGLGLPPQSGDYSLRDQRARGPSPRTAHDLSADAGLARARSRSAAVNIFLLAGSKQLAHFTMP